MKIIKSFLIIAIALIATTNISFAQTDASTQVMNITKSIDVKVKGVTCTTDLKLIADNVEKLDGVTSCVTLKKGATTTLQVKMNPTLVTEKQIYTAIEDTACCKNPDARPYKVKL